MAHLRKLIIDTLGSIAKSQNRCFSNSQILTATISAKKFNRLEKLKQEEIPSFSEFLIDNYRREHNYLRISVTERCNLRCTYCMPEEGVPLTPKEKLLSTEEVIRLARLFVSQGVDKIRITGGEPLIRIDLATIIENISKLKIKSIGITTNGLLIPRHLPKLLDSGLTHLNISLDSLQSKKFEKISRRPQSAWIKVWKGIEMALDSPQLQCLKLNCVVMRGTNDDEIIQFVDLTKERNLDVRFIEYMPFSGNKWDYDKMVPYQEMIELIKKKYPNMEKLEDSVNHTSKGWKIPGHVGQFGFITSMSDHFCGGCNRLRITADGNLKVCLFGNAEVSLRDTIRNGASDEDLLSFIGQAVKRKHAKHAGMMNLAKMENRPMILIENQNQRQKWIFSNSNTLKNINSLSFTTTTSNISNFNTVNSLRPFSTTSSNTTEKNIDSDTTDKKKQGNALSHVDSQGKINMVDVSDKNPTLRIAEAEATVILSPLAFKAIQDNQVKKGDVLTVSKLAGIMGAKQTSNLIPLCHPLPLNRVDVQIKLNPDNYSINIRSLAKTNSNTGVEMEALMACTISSLTIYDMCKALDKSIIIKDIRLIKKTGGKSSDFSIYQ